MSIGTELKQLSRNQEWGFAGFLLLLIAIVIHLYDINLRLTVSGSPFFNWLIILLYILLALMATILLPDPTGIGLIGKLKKFPYFLFISFLAYIMPGINYIADLLSGLFGLLDIPIKLIASVIIIFAPLWVLVIMYVETTKITRIIGSVYAIGWIIIVLISISPMMATIMEEQGLPAVSGVMPGFTARTIYTKVVAGWQTTVSKIEKARVEVPAEIRAEYEFAKTGIDPREAKIDASKQQDINVIMEQIRITSQTAYTNSPIIVSTTLKAKTLEAPTQITMKCLATSEPVQGKIFPKSEFYIETSDTQEIDCIIPALEPGRHTITLTADFNFETLSNIETFFMPEETIKQLKNKKIDPMAGYPQPEAITSSGPINLNIHTPEAPIPATEDKKFIIGITVLNTGGGTLKDITDLYLYLPKGIEISPASDDSQENIYQKISCADLKEKEICDENKAEIYKVLATELNKPQYKNIKIGTEFRVYLTIQDYSTLIGDSPIKPGSITASIKYNYQLEQKIDVDVKSLPAEAST